MAYSIGAFWRGLQIKDIDLIFTSVPPIFAGPAGWLLALVKRVPFSLDVQDLWPDALEVRGILKSQFFLRPLYTLASFLYRKACFIVTVTYGIREELQKKRIAPGKIAVLPNGFDSELFEIKVDRDNIRRRCGWNNDFVAIYIGNHTEVTSLDTIVEAAEKLKEFPGIRFEIYGSGSTTRDLERMIREKGLANCRLSGSVGKEKVPSLLFAADVCLMCLFETPLAHIYLQNKLFDYMGAGKPIVAALRGHQRQIIEGIGGGMCVDPKDASSLARAILELSQNPELCRMMGARNRSYALRHFCLDDILDRQAEFVIACASGKIPTVRQDSISSLLGSGAR
jgi:glycosyltransferase involved in cell wall biosynthesis